MSAPLAAATPPRRRLAFTSRPAGVVAVHVWGATLADADQAESLARQEALIYGWRVESVIRVVGGKASQARPEVPAWRVIRRHRAYGQEYLITDQAVGERAWACPAPLGSAVSW